MSVHIERHVDRVTGAAGIPKRRPRRSRRRTVETVLLAVLALAMLFPAAWIVQSSIKQQVDILAVPAKFVDFVPTLHHYKDIFAASDGFSTPIGTNFVNSVIVAGLSTLLATVLGVPAAWAYSRFKVKAKKDQLFFILSTRFMPAVVVVIPIFLMYRELGLYDTKLGLILLYAAFNLPFTIWMMKGFVDEVSPEYEDAAMMDGYSRFEAFWRFSLPLLVPGIAATAVFALIFSWNEFVYAIFLTTGGTAARTAPPAIAGLVGSTPIDWGLIAASATLFALPVLVFAFLVRRYLVAGVTLGAVRR
jgi:multiple sugar transport system permease protein